MLVTEETAQSKSNGIQSLAQRYRAIREQTERLCEPLTLEDCAIQSMTDASPVKWHLAHTTWFFETLVLLPSLPGYRAFHPAFQFLFNSYYNALGERHPRERRGVLSRPTLPEVISYRRAVDEHILRSLADDDPPLPEHLLEAGLQHEQQHQELIITDVKHLFAENPLRPAYHERDSRQQVNGRDSRFSALDWHEYSGGVVAIGFEGDGFSYDNEQPRHEVYLQPFELASRLITNLEYCQFIDDGGYQRPEFWLAEGWDLVQNQMWHAPLNWEHAEEGWHVFTLWGLQPLEPGEPVCHVSYFEADAFARWANARLPTESEWEHVATEVPVAGNFADSGRLHPKRATDLQTDHPHQLFGDVWEWTASAYLPYPGFRQAPGALSEYNGKFMCNQFVLRGGSCATPATHIRATYRNFFAPDKRWQFSGIRLAR